MSPVDHPFYQPVSRAKDASVEVAVPGPEGSYVVTVTRDGYQAADDVERSALDAQRDAGLLQFKSADTPKED